ncbi:ThiF family adenylyltransferase [uncultured Pseudodesulfovibrio sp.]|uniref:ThiF family adenylyltransferase n=1 Tax=uncultured Pseudodesulfovibrio sp. TaxID=2035858 RepID=UPI0029C7D483|nr:ThiF family adenylyltransferase [uncultured Pseudodesulfovibrio sp.]
MRNNHLSLKMSGIVYNQIFLFIGSHPAERGGILGMDKDGVIRHFIPDAGAKTSYASYSPDVAFLNPRISQWKRKGITFCGVVHSHPRGIIQPSEADRQYAAQILKIFKSIDRLWLPIVQSSIDSKRFDILGYYAELEGKKHKKCRIRKVSLDVLGLVSPHGEAYASVSNKYERNRVPTDLDHLDSCYIYGPPCGQLTRQERSKHSLYEKFTPRSNAAELKPTPPKKAATLPKNDAAPASPNPTITTREEMDRTTQMPRGPFHFPAQHQSVEEVTMQRSVNNASQAHRPKGTVKVQEDNTLPKGTLKCDALVASQSEISDNPSAAVLECSTLHTLLHGTTLQNGIARQGQPTQLPPLSKEEASLYVEASRIRDRHLERHEGSYNLSLLDKTRLVIVGTGGASSLVTNCARMGFGEFVLIDPDIISSSNVGTQKASPHAIGQHKVERLAEEIRDINPTASVLAIPAELDAINDDLMQRLYEAPLRSCQINTAKGLIWAPFSPDRTILLVLTDSFIAQSRGHRLALHFGIPTVCAQEYTEGLGGEITYTIPGVTTTCHRCITSSRYKAYLEEGYTNIVTSAGAPIFAAEYLNAVIGHMLLAVTHHGTDHERWGHTIADLGQRNLLRLRMDPHFDKRFGVDAFTSRLKGLDDQHMLQMFDTLFLTQTPDCGQTPQRPICPDCGGTGDLSKAVGTFADTRQIRTARKV